MTHHLPTIARKAAIGFLGLMQPALLSATEMYADTSSILSHRLDEITIVCNPKVESELFYLPSSVTLIGSKSLQEMHASSIKDLSTVAANLFIPDYGSRLITSAYIRGIGSRINSPAVGMSVDNVPFLDKSAYDCSLLDVARIEVLRGPQGVLYGRNTMAGLINIYTYSPLDRQGTTIQLGGGNYDAYEVSALTAHKITDNLAFTAGARYESRNGYFTNTYTGKSSGKTYAASGRFRLDWRASQRVVWSLNAHFEHSYQDGYPYASFDPTTHTMGDIAYNSPSSYLRNLLATGLTMEYKHDHFLLTSTTGYQYLDDDMRLDQDFTPLSVFTLNQQQRLHAFTQEVALRSTGKGTWHWVAGAFGSYQNMHTDAPVDFLEDGMRLLVEGQSNAALAALKAEHPTMPDITLDIDNENLHIGGLYDTPSYSLALFGQVEARRILGSRLSASIGARLEYESMSITHHTSSDNLNGTAHIAMGNMSLPVPFSAPLGLEGSSRQSTTQFLPKFELKYIHNRDFMTYLSVSRGYRSGGYNYQMFSNLIQAQMRSHTMTAVADGAVDMVLQLMGDSPIAQRVTETIKNMLSGTTTSSDDAATIEEAITYKPEHSWNYEIGFRANIWQRRLTTDLALFYIDCRDQQISCVSGYGRVTRNSGRTRSFGVEASVQAVPIDELRLTASYGFTHATFLQYDDGENNYAGHFVPFAPMHSLAVTAAYTWYPAQGHALTVATQFMGRGRIYWTEANNVSQPFYGLLDASLTYQWKWIEAGLWGKNLTATRYQAFYFETMNALDLSTPSGFIQPGTPLTFGATLAFHF